MEPATFQFVVRGTIGTPSETLQIDETYQPTEDVLNKKVNGGYVAKYIDINNSRGTITVHLEVSCPAGKQLVCLFHGIK